MSQLSLPLALAARRPLPQVLLGGVRDRLRYFGINGISNVEQNGGAEHEYSRRGCVDLGRGAGEGVEQAGVTGPMVPEDTFLKPHLNSGVAQTRFH